MAEVSVGHSHRLKAQGTLDAACGESDALSDHQHVETACANLQMHRLLLTLEGARGGVLGVLRVVIRWK